jgi:ribosomal protein S18 acetylase RimI-like enzyme
MQTTEKKSITYRLFQPKDKKILTELIKNLYKEDPNEKPASLRNIKKTFDTLAKHPDKGAILVIINNKKVIGYAIIINFWSNEFGGNIAHIDEFYIQKDFRSQGIGTNFIKNLIKKKFNKSVALQLEVTPGNKKARSLYEKLGFKKEKNAFLRLEIKK